MAISRNCIAPLRPEGAALLGTQAHRRVPGKLLPRSIQFGIAVTPWLPHRVHRMCRPSDDTGTSSGQASTLTSVLPQARQVAKSERTPRLRMLPSVMGRIGSSERGMSSILSPAATCGNRLGAATSFSINGLSRLPAWPDLSGWPDAG